MINHELIKFKSISREIYGPIEYSMAHKGPYKGNMQEKGGHGSEIGRANYSNYFKFQLLLTVNTLNIILGNLKCGSLI